MKLACYLVLLASLWAPIATADGPTATKAAPKYYVPEVPEDMAPVEFYLMTIGLGNDVASRFGHTGIRIKNPVEGTDVVFNWGKFYFDAPNFLWKFFRGELTYSMGVRSYQGDVMHYMQSGQRLVMERINLTTKQKRRLMEKIAWNAVPENRDFQYQYWTKNCATIPRDDIDDVLEGQVRARYFEQHVPKVYRDYVRDNLGTEPFVAPLLDLFMNSNIDKPITAWEEMFLPGQLRTNLLAMPAIDDEGNPVPNSHLLSDTQVLLDRPEEMTRPFNDELVLVAPIWLGLAGALLIFAKKRPKLMAWGYRSLGLAAGYWGFLGGLLGTVLLLNWAFSGHPDGWHNVNVMLLWPLDFLLLPLGISLMRKGRPVKDRLLFLHSARLLCSLHLAALALLIGLSAGHVVEQNIWRVVGYFGPALVLLAIAMMRFGFAAEKSQATVVTDEAAAQSANRAGKGKMNGRALT